MNFRVRLDAAVVVRNVSNSKDAISVAVAEIGRKLNRSKLNFVEIEPKKGPEVIANTALVGLDLAITVFDAESEEHATRIAKSVIGKALTNIPLELTSVTEVDEEESEEEDDWEEEEEEWEEEEEGDEWGKEEPQAEEDDWEESGWGERQYKSDDW